MKSDEANLQMKPEELILARAILKRHSGELRTAASFFEFLFDNAFFQSKEAANAYVRATVDIYGIPEKEVKKFYIYNIREKMQAQNFKTSREAFEYIDGHGCFFDDTAGRARFLQMAEQDG